jgi:UDP-N-acetylmuramyl pentapeptide synthase
MQKASASLLKDSLALRYWNSVEDMLPEVSGQALGCTSILVKGSRFMKMERVVHALTALQTKPNGAQREGAHAA